MKKMDSEDDENEVHKGEKLGTLISLNSNVCLHPNLYDTSVSQFACTLWL